MWSVQARLCVGLSVLGAGAAIKAALDWPESGYNSALRGFAAGLGVVGAVSSGLVILKPRIAALLLALIASAGALVLAWLYIAAGPLFLIAGIVAGNARRPASARLFRLRASAEVLAVPLLVFTLAPVGIGLLLPQLMSASPSLQPGEQRVDVGRRYEATGASVVGPQGKWTLSERSVVGHALDFARDFDNPVAATTPQGAHSVILSLEVLPRGAATPATQSALERITREADAAHSIGRFRLTSSSSSPERFGGAECRRYERIATDNGVPSFPGFTFAFVFHGILCIHPSQPQIVRLDYSERFLIGQKELGDAEVRASFTSLQFLDRALPEQSVTVSPSPAATAVRTAFSSGMTSASNGPAELDQPPISRRYGPDGFEVKLSVAGSYRVRVNLTNLRDMRVEADVVFHRSSNEVRNLMPNAGVICRATPDGVNRAEYFFQIYVDGGYSISRVTGARAEVWKVIGASAGRTSPSIRATGSNHIQADCIGGGPVTLVLVVNGETLLIVTDNDATALTGSGGGAGVEIDTGDEPGFGAAFKDLVVKELRTP